MSRPDDPLFVPDGVTWNPVERALASARRAVLAAGSFLVAIAGGLLLGQLVNRWLGALVAVAAAVGFVVGWVLIGRNQRSWRYAERQQDLLVSHGVMFRSLVVVPYGRMQFVDVSSGPVARAFGIATVELHTATPATDATIPGLRPEDAARLRDTLARLGNAQVSGL